MQIVIGIPTFRRPGPLEALLASLAPERAAAARIIIADNGVDQAVRAIAARHDAAYLPVPARGLAAVRIRLIAAAHAEVPGWDWLAMLDDDGTVGSGWLAALIACGARFDADLVGGTVAGDLPPGAGRLARSSVLAGRHRAATGPVPMLSGAQNLLIARRLIDRLDAPHFDRRLDRSGGEDYAFFRRAVAAGARLVWCAEAVVHEPAPPAALAPRAILGRYFATGLATARVDRRLDGAPRAAGAALRGLAGATARGTAGLLRGDLDGAAAALLLLHHHGGRVAGLLGATTARYGQ